MNSRDANTTANTNERPTALRMHLLRGIGLVCVALGTIGAFVPLLPTTVFFIAAVYCFATSAPAWRQRILDHPRFGPPVRSFVRDGTLSRRAKAIAVGGIAVNLAVTLFLLDFAPVASAVLVAVLALVSAYILSRPEPAPVPVRA